jgi:hypothetical protein
LPLELQKRVHEEVERTKARCGWPAVQTLKALGISRRSYYRWLKEEAWAKALPTEAVRLRVAAVGRAFTDRARNDRNGRLRGHIRSGRKGGYCR